MATSQIRRKGADPKAKADGKNSGMTIDAGPYEAIVKNHVEGSRMGQLQVFIPDFGGAVSPDSNYITVSYASPFYGQTYGTDDQDLPDGAATSGQSYGMWMVPPDVGCKVLVVFIGGDLNRGYWFACVYDGPSHHMVPGLGRAIGGSSVTSLPSATLAPYVGNNSNLPVTEYSTTVSGAFTANALVTTPRRPHEVQSFQYIRQGLDRDLIRGAVSSSSLRESPSNVYGISTPGRKATKTDQVAGSPQQVIYRTGGHQFVMDDGSAADGTDQLMRMRTAGGHQIMMNDTEQIVYIASASGNQWIEFSADGSLNVYGAAGINMRSEGPINLHSDTEINMQAAVVNINGSSPKGGGVNITTTGAFALSGVLGGKVSSDGPLSVSSVTALSMSGGAMASLSSIGPTKIAGSILSLNCGLPTPPIPSFPAKMNMVQDTVNNNGIWTSVNGQLQTICTKVPAHEPWVGTDGKSRPASIGM